ncbi:MAG TPA: hypothetical protein VIK03_05015 [Thermoleophilia bacterium]
MKKRMFACAVVLALATLILPAAALAGEKGSAAKRGAVSGIRADATCHSPCDDPFQVKAWVRGSSVGGLVVKFNVKGKVFTARTTSGGYAHYHLSMRPSTYPQGVVVKVVATVKHGGETKAASTWFKPNYN